MFTSFHTASANASPMAQKRRPQTNTRGEKAPLLQCDLARILSFSSISSCTKAPRLLSKHVRRLLGSTLPLDEDQITTLCAFLLQILYWHKTCFSFLWHPGVSRVIPLGLHWKTRMSWTFSRRTSPLSLLPFVSGDTLFSWSTFCAI